MPFIPKSVEYTAIGALIGLLIYLYRNEKIERKENEKEYKTELAKIQAEKDKLYAELSSNKKELDEILEKLKGL